MFFYSRRQFKSCKNNEKTYERCEEINGQFYHIGSNLVSEIATRGEILYLKHVDLLKQRT